MLKDGQEIKTMASANLKNLEIQRSLKFPPLEQENELIVEQDEELANQSFCKEDFLPLTLPPSALGLNEEIGPNRFEDQIIRSPTRGYLNGNTRNVHPEGTMYKAKDFVPARTMAYTALLAKHNLKTGVSNSTVVSIPASVPTIVHKSPVRTTLAVTHTPSTEKKERIEPYRKEMTNSATAEMIFIQESPSKIRAKEQYLGLIREKVA